ncbi:MAG: AAA family ATPase, partial [Candidatus ainarchaeum sp.]|nr:AAA family ATPase [Candidatus ainarchaeum sp.]
MDKIVWCINMIIVMGLPGAGKTTVLQGAQEKKPEYKILNYGTLMLEIASEKFGVKDRDKIRTLSPDEQKEIQALVGKKLSKYSEKDKIILDTHCSVLNPEKEFYLPGLPYSLLKE